MTKFINVSSLVFAVLTTFAASSQAAIDVAPVVTTLSDGIAACTAIGVAMLTVWAIKMVYKMIRG